MIKTKYYLGIDVAKNRHEAALLDSNKQLLGPTVKFANNYDSFQNMLAAIKKQLPQKTTNDQIRAGMESTGHYWINLNNFLLANGLQNIQIINPIETQQAAKKRIRKVKNDKIDSIEISKIIQEKDKNEIKNNYQPETRVVKLKKTTRFRDKLKKQEQFYKREIKAILEVICPEFEGLFKQNIFLETPLALLEKYSDLRKLKKAKAKTFALFLHKKSRGRIKELRSNEILDSLNNSIGQENRDELSALQLQMMLSNLKTIKKQIEKIEEEVEKQSDEFTCKEKIVSIKGVSSKMAAVAIAEIGEVNRFQNKNQLTAFAGLDASVCQSGDYQRKQGNRISKRGSKYLRKQLYYAAKTAIIFDPELKAFYQRKKNEGKHYNIIVIAVARKILHRIYRVWKDNRFYEIKKATDKKQ